MSTVRIATFVAVLGGSLLGSLAAALSVAYGPPAEAATDGSTAAHETSSARAVTPSATPPRELPSAPPSSTAVASAPSPSAASGRTTLETEDPLPNWLEEPLPADAEAVAMAALSCARGHANDCMRAGDAYESGRGAEPDERKARLNRVAGARLFDEACKKRHPEACYSLAVIYSLGLGVKPNPEIAKGQMTITRGLCKTVDAELCGRLPPVDAE